MGVNKEVNQKEIDNLAGNLVKLTAILRQEGPARDLQWWNDSSPLSLFAPMYGYQDGLPLFDVVVTGVLKLNPLMLSKYEVDKRIAYDFIEPQVVDSKQSEHLDNESLIEKARGFIKELMEFQAWQDVDIPIVNLWLEGEPIKIGNVTFLKIGEQELEKWKEKEVLWPKKLPDVVVIASVNAPGDQQNALDYARKQVDITLSVLRAFCFPFDRNSDKWQVGISGDNISISGTPMRINNKEFVYQLGPGLFNIELRQHILPKFEPAQLDLINDLIIRTDYSNMEGKLIDAIKWLAESTKPDTKKAKYTKISFALEALIGGEPSIYLTSMGITAMLAERAAFIAGENLEDRQSIDKDVRDCYRKRGGIVHGGQSEVSFEDIDMFGKLVRRLALALLVKLDNQRDQLSTVDELAKWVMNQRYVPPVKS